MATPMSPAQMQEAVDLRAEHGSSTLAAAALSISRSTFDSRYRSALAAGYRAHAEPQRDFEHAPIPSERVPVDELVERRKSQFAQKARHEEATKLRAVKVNLDGPIGILHFGDPHVDDDGTDIAALERHTDLVNKTEGLFAANVGDTTNNWVGRLARLYGEQSTSAVEAWDLAEWFIGRCEWLYMISGNHDAWSGAGDPIRWMKGKDRRGKATPYASEVRLALRFPNGAEIRVNARHDFAGSSIYNPAHGAMKALTWGVRDHIAVCGHKHVSGYGVVKDPDTGIACHAIQVASYKKFDRYAKERGFRDQTLSPCALTTINPALAPTDPDLVKVFWTPEEGADYLRFLRRRLTR